MKLRTKLILGFAAVIFVMIAQGATSVVMFKRVDANIAAVTRDRLPAVKYATAVERSALETILEEKNYLLLKSDHIRARAAEKLKQLASLLGEIDKLAEAAHNTELASHSAGARRAATDYGKLYDQAAEAITKNQAEETVMDQKGDIVSEEAAALLKAKRAEFQQASNALAIINNINAWALDMRLNEKTYMLNHESMAFNAVERNIANLLDAYGALEKLNPNETEKKQIANARKATQDYAKALGAWVAEYKRDAKSATLADFLKSMNRSGDTVSQMVDDYTLTKQADVEKLIESVFIVTGIAQEALGARFSEKSYIIERNPNDWETLNVQVQGLTKLYASLRKVAPTAEDKSRIDRAARATEDYLAAVNAWAKNDAELRNAILPKMKNDGDAVIAAAQAIQNDAWKGSDGVNAATRSIITTSNWVIVAALGIGILVGAVLARAITLSITRPINRIIEGLSCASEQVSSAAAEVSSASQQLAGGTSQQAASIEETSSSLEEMSAMTRQNADNAGQANQLMAGAGKMLSEADESMGRLTGSMQAITQASEETQKIIKTIDEIAFQTNLLALNAAVEAARAGEAGAGFAVVADEVRNLAMRAADAAKNTADLIEGTVKRVKEGSGVVAKANEAFQRVNRSTAKATELVGEIAAASSEQAQGITQINTAVSEMDKLTQQNAANAEESASAAEEMATQAGQLSEMVGDLVALVDGRPKQEDVSAEAAQQAPDKANPAAACSVSIFSKESQRAQPAAEQIIPLDEKEL
ncbi:MAG: methyl-accepting chemotaxis protein [Hyphomicrobiales bacterium]